MKIVVISAALVIGIGVAHGRFDAGVKTSPAHNPSAMADIPQEVNYQGFLTDEAGQPISDTLNVVFSIWTDSVGGTQVWSEAQTVEVLNGIFSVLLPVPSYVFDDTNRWLEMSIEGEPLSSRTKLASVGYTYTSLLADSARITGTIPSDIVTSANILDGTIETIDLAFEPVTCPIGTSCIQDGAVTNSKLASNSVTSPKIANDAVGSTEIATGAVGVLELSDNSVTTLKIANSAVNSDKLADDAVITSKIANSAVTPQKLDRSYVNLSSDQIVGGQKTFTQDIICHDDVWAGTNKAFVGYNETGQNGYLRCFTRNNNRLVSVNYLDGTDGLNGGVWVYRDGAARGYYYVDSDDGADIFLANSAGYWTIWLDGSSGTIYKSTCNFRMNHPLQPDKDIIYCSVEGPEAAAYIRGTAKLINGETYVSLPDHFTWVVNEKTMTVQITPLSAQSEGLAIIRKDAEGFSVKELRNGKGNYEFDYFVQAVRKGYEDYQVIRDKVIPKEAGSAAVEQWSE